MKMHAPGCYSSTRGFQGGSADNQHILNADASFCYVMFFLLSVVDQLYSLLPIPKALAMELGPPVGVRVEAELEKETVVKDVLLRFDLILREHSLV
jgi:hypothetical protein